MFVGGEVWLFALSSQIFEGQPRPFAGCFWLYVVDLDASYEAFLVRKPRAGCIITIQKAIA